MKRKIVALVLACTMGLSMVACGGSSDSASKSSSNGDAAASKLSINKL